MYEKINQMREQIHAMSLADIMSMEGVDLDSPEAMALIAHCYQCKTTYGKLCAALSEAHKAFKEGKRGNTYRMSEFTREEEG